MSIATLAFLSLIVAASAFVQGVVGVGFALIAAPILGLVAPGMIPVVVLILMLPLNLYVAIREWRALDTWGASWITAGRVAGGWLGVLLVAAVSSRTMNLFIGLSTIGAAALSLAAPSFRPGRFSFVGAGLVTGITETATGIGGPPLALIYQYSPAPVLRSTIAVCFLLGELISLVMLVAKGQVAPDMLTDSLMLIPAVLAGAYLSRLFHHRIGGRGLRTGVMVFSIAAGLAVLLKECI